MAYSEALAERIRLVFRHRGDIVEKKMFGGLAFLMNGNLLVGVWTQSLIARLGAAQARDALTQEFVGPFEPAGTPMTGWVVIAPEGVDLDEQLKSWIALAEKFVETLPAK